MGLDDDRSCIEHVWQLTRVGLHDDGAEVEYRCVRCDGLLVVPPGGMHPNTV